MEDWSEIDLKYQELVLEASKKSQDFDIENSDIDHAKFLSYLLVERAKHNIKIFTGSLKELFYSDKRIQSAFKSLSDKVKVNIIIADGEGESQDFIKFAKSKGFNIKKLSKSVKVKNHFLLSDDKAFRLEAVHDNNLIRENVKGIANFNSPSVVKKLAYVFDNELLNNVTDIK